MESQIRILTISTGMSPDNNGAGHELTKKYLEWQKQNPEFAILDVHTTSNTHGWMITIKYKKQ